MTIENNKKTAAPCEQQLLWNKIENNIIQILVDNKLSISESKVILNSIMFKFGEQKVISNRE